jgi:hypothetical protein
MTDPGSATLHPHLLMADLTSDAELRTGSRCVMYIYRVLNVS